MRDRKPAELKALMGNPSKEPNSKSAVKSITGAPSPPADLSGEAFAEWARVTSYLKKVGRIESIDRAALTVYCQAWAMYVKAADAFEEHGPLVVGRDGGFVKNPAAQIMRDAADTMLKYGGRFGFSPKDRQNLGITAEDGGEDELGAILGAV